MRKKPSASNLKVSIVSLNGDGCCWIRFKLFGLFLRNKHDPAVLLFCWTKILYLLE